MTFMNMTHFQCGPTLEPARQAGVNVAGSKVVVGAMAHKA
jgi:hypothetical protein